MTKHNKYRENGSISPPPAVLMSYQQLPLWTEDFIFEPKDQELAHRVVGHLKMTTSTTKILKKTPRQLT